MNLLTLQQQFKDVLLQKADASSLPLRQGKEGDNTSLFLYQNNLYEGLYKNLKNKFSITSQWLGEEEFFEKGREYIFNFPQSSPYLCAYGEYFPRILSDRVSQELAGLEWKMNGVLIAYESMPSLKIEDLLAIPPQLMGGVSFRLHPCIDLHVSAYALKELWIGLKKNKKLSAYHSSSYFFIFVENMRSTFSAITQEEYDFIKLIKEGKSLGEAYDSMDDENSFQAMLNKFIPYFKEIINKPF